jgi:hypothetical protein
MPFSYTLPNFGNGEVEFGFADPGAADNSAIIKQFQQAVLPEGKLAGMKKDLMPIFSNIAQNVFEQPMLFQTRGKMKNTRWGLDGASHLPDDLRIDPKAAYNAFENVPTDIPETNAELMLAFESMGYNPNSTSGSLYAPTLPRNTMVQNTEGLGTYYPASSDFWAME